MVVGVHAYYGGWAQLRPPPFRELFSPWAPGLKLSPAPEWENPTPALKVPLYVDRFGPLWLLLTASIPITSMTNFFNRLAHEEKGRQGLLPLVLLQPSRPLTLRDWPGKVFFELVLEIDDWVEEAAVNLGPRVTPRPTMVVPTLLRQSNVQLQLPAQTEVPSVAPSPPVTQPAAAPAATALAAAPVTTTTSEVPWEVPTPQPLPAAMPAAAQVVTAGHDPFEVFRRR
jgi:hypothetical protein